MKGLQVYADRLEELRTKDLLRTLRPLEASHSRGVVRGGRACLDFSSNDYLGLSHHPALREAAHAWMGEWGVGSRASRLVTGTSRALVTLEERLAEFKGTERALVFCSGFQANASVLAALLEKAVVGRGALVFSDRLIHASLHFGCAAAGVGQIRFRHNDLAHLRSLLEREKDTDAFRMILVESVYSMDGDRADLLMLRALADEFDAFLFVDEAHATGVLGPRGAGLVAEAGIVADCVVGTFSKAMGSSGAYVACSGVLADYLVNRCQGLVYSTGLSPGVLGAIDAALALVPAMDSERVKLQEKAGQLRAWLAQRGVACGHSSTQIVPVMIGAASQAMLVAKGLEERGLLVPAIRPPTVPEGEARLRVSLSVSHQDEDLAALKLALAEVLDLGTLETR